LLIIDSNIKGPTHNQYVPTIAVLHV
jgi:hypothetical protein